MEFHNTWYLKHKSKDKFALKCRIGRLTLLDIYGSWAKSKRTLSVNLFNFLFKF